MIADSFHILAKAKDWMSEECYDIFTRHLKKCYKISCPSIQKDDYIYIYKEIMTVIEGKKDQ